MLTRAQYNQASLILPMEGIANQTSFSDASPGVLPITALGGAKIQTSPSVWGRGSGLFSGGYLYTPSTPALDLGSGDFTLACWVRLSAFTNRYQAMLANNQASWNAACRSWIIYGSGSGKPTGAVGLVRHSTGVTDALLSASTLALNIWYYLALVRFGNTLSLFINGALDNQVAADATLWNFATPGTHVGYGQWDGTNGQLQGALQDLIVIKGAALWTAPFAPPARVIAPWLHALKYRYPGTIPAGVTISGTATQLDHGGADQVVVRDAETRLPFAVATPNATTGAWSAEVPAGDYDLSYFAADCQPLCHGPYTIM